MDKRHNWPRVACTTPMCWNDGRFSFEGRWQSNEHCEYAKVLCPVCHATYWMVKRDEKFSLFDRKEGEEFDHRKADR